MKSSHNKKLLVSKYLNIFKEKKIGKVAQNLEESRGFSKNPKEIQGNLKNNKKSLPNKHSKMLKSDC